MNHTGLINLIQDHRSDFVGDSWTPKHLFQRSRIQRILTSAILCYREVETLDFSGLPRRSTLERYRQTMYNSLRIASVNQNRDHLVFLRSVITVYSSFQYILNFLENLRRLGYFGPVDSTYEFDVGIE